MQALPPIKLQTTMIQLSQLDPSIINLLLEEQFINNCQNDLTFIFVLILLIYFLDNPAHSEFTTYYYDNDFPYFEEIIYNINDKYDTGCIICKKDNYYIVLSRNAKFLRITPDKISQIVKINDLDLSKYRNSLLNVLYLLFIKYVSNKTKQQIDVKKLLPQVIFDMNNLNAEQHVLKREESFLKESNLKEMLKILKKMIYNFEQACPEFNIAELDQKLNINLHASIQNALNIKNYLQNNGVKFSNTINAVEQNFEFLIPPLTVMLNYSELDTGTIDLIDIGCKIYEMDRITVVKDLNKIKSFFNTRFFIFFKSLDNKQINDLASSLGIQLVGTKGGSKSRKFKIRKSKTHKFKEYKPKTRKFKPKTRKVQRGGSKLLLTIIIIVAIFVKFSNSSSGFDLVTDTSKAALNRVAKAGVYITFDVVSEQTGMTRYQIMNSHQSIPITLVYNNRLTQFKIDPSALVSFKGDGSIVAMPSLYSNRNHDDIDFSNTDFDDGTNYVVDDATNYGIDNGFDDHPFRPTLTKRVKFLKSPASNLISTNSQIVSNVLNIIPQVNSGLMVYNDYIRSKNFQQFVLGQSTKYVMGKATSYVVTQASAYLVPGLAAQLTPAMPIVNAAIFIYQVHQAVTYDPVAEIQKQQQIIELQNRIDEYKRQDEYNSILQNLVNNDDFITVLANSNNMLGDIHFWGGVNFKNVFNFQPVYRNLVNKIFGYMEEASKENNIAKINYWANKITLLNKIFERSQDDMGKNDENSMFGRTKTTQWLKNFLNGADNTKTLGQIYEYEKYQYEKIYFEDNGLYNTDVIAETANGPKKYEATSNHERQKSLKPNDFAISELDMFFSDEKYNNKIYQRIAYKDNEYTAHLSKMSSERYKKYIEKNYDGDGNLLNSAIVLRDTKISVDEGHRQVAKLINENYGFDGVVSGFSEFMIRAITAPVALVISATPVPDMLRHDQKLIPKEPISAYFEIRKDKTQEFESYLKKVNEWKKSLFPPEEYETIVEVLKTTPVKTIENIDSIVALTKELVGTTESPAKVTGSPTIITAKIRATIFKYYKDTKGTDLSNVVRTFLDVTNNIPTSFDTDYEEAWNRNEALRVKDTNRKIRKTNIKNEKINQEKIDEYNEDVNDLNEHIKNVEEYLYKTGTLQKPVIGPANKPANKPVIPPVPINLNPSYTTTTTMSNLNDVNDVNDKNIDANKLTSFYENDFNSNDFNSYSLAGQSFFLIMAVVGGLVFIDANSDNTHNVTWDTTSANTTSANLNTTSLIPNKIDFQQREMQEKYEREMQRQKHIQEQQRQQQQQEQQKQRQLNNYEIANNGQKITP